MKSYLRILSLTLAFVLGGVVSPAHAQDPELRVFLHQHPTTNSDTLVLQEGDVGGSSGRIFVTLRTSNNMTVPSDIMVNMRVQLPQGGIWVSTNDNGGWIDGNGNIVAGSAAPAAGDFGIPDLARPQPANRTGTIRLAGGRAGYLRGINVGNNANNPAFREAIFEIMPGTGYTVSPTAGKATAHIYDDDPKFGISAGKGAAGSNVTFTLTTPTALTAAHPVALNITSNGTNTFSGTPATTFTFPSGVTSHNISIPLATTAVGNTVSATILPATQNSSNGTAHGHGRSTQHHWLTTIGGPVPPMDQLEIAISRTGGGGHEFNGGWRYEDAIDDGRFFASIRTNPNPSSGSRARFNGVESYRIRVERTGDAGYATTSTAEPSAGFFHFGFTTANTQRMPLTPVPANANQQYEYDLVPSNGRFHSYIEFRDVDLDTTDETSATYIVSLLNPDGSVASTANYTVVDNDPTIEIAAGEAMAGGTATFQLTTDNGTPTTIANEIQVSITSNGSNSFSGTPPTSVTFPAGVASHNFTVALASGSGGDNITATVLQTNEGNMTAPRTPYRASTSAGSASVVATGTTPTPTLTIRANQTSVTAGENVTFIVESDIPFPRDYINFGPTNAERESLRFNYGGGISSVTTPQNGDPNTNRTIPVTSAAGDSTQSALGMGNTNMNITITTTDAYGGGTATLTLSGQGIADASTLTFGSPSSASVTINSPGTPATPTISVASNASGGSVTQGESFRITLTRPGTTGDQPYTFDVSGGAASVGYVDASGNSATLTTIPSTGVTGAIADGFTTTNLVVTASTTSSDQIVVSFAGTGVSFNPSTIRTNVDVPARPRAQLNASVTLAASGVVDEGDSLVATITLDGAAESGGERVRIFTEPATTGDVAIAGREYAVVNTTLVVPQGQTEATYSLRTLENNVYRGSAGTSAFDVRVQAERQLTASMPDTATINDNDAVPELVIEGPSRVAPGRNGTFTIRSLTSVSDTEIANIDLLVNGSAVAVYTGDPSVLHVSPTTNNTMVEVALAALADRVQFVVTAAVPANASEELDPILVFFDPTSSQAGASGFYNITHGRGSLVATAQVVASGLNPVALNEVVLPHAVAGVIDEVGQALASRSQNSFGDDGFARGFNNGFTINGETPLGFVSTLARREAVREAAENPWDSPVGEGREAVSLRELAADGELSLVLPLNRGEGSGSFTIWAEAFTRSIDGEQTAGGGSAGAGGSPIEFDGDVPGAIFGADARVGENLLAGIAVASATADFEYVSVDDTGGRLVGTHETELSSYHPYIGYRTEGGTNVWANLGVGEGEVTISERGDAASGANYVGEVETLSYAVGFTNLREGREDGLDGLALNYHGDVSFTSIEESPTARTRGSGAFDGRLAGSEIAQTRARLGARLSHTQQHADGEGESRSSLGLAFRYDEGDTAEGGAVEIDAGVGVSLGDNLRLDLSGRTLLFHEESVDDWGFGGGFVWRGNPTGFGRGLALSVRPEWGNTVSRADAVLDGFGAVGAGLGADAGDAGDASGDVKARYGFDVQYGLAVFGEGLLVPFVRGDAGDVGGSAVWGGQYSFGGFASGVEVTADDDQGNAFIRYERDF